MQLFDFPENPAPPGGIVTMISGSDGLTIRTARWPATMEARATIVVAGGRGEFIEKYFEVIGELLARGFAVVAFDWRGQGLSVRELPNPRKGHIDDFLLYERDLDALQRQIIAPFCPKPWFGLGHSMGGAILMMNAGNGRSMFERLVLSAPMLGLAGMKYPKAMQFLMASLDMIGFGGAFVPGGGETPYLTRPFLGNVLTSDPARHDRTAAVVAHAPQLALGSPTIGWLDAAFRLIGQFDEVDYAARIPVPCLIIAAGNDRVVDTNKAERFGLAMKLGRTLTIPQAEHEILVERDVFREQFWAAFDAYLPGTR